MKIITQEEADAHQRAAITGGLKGFIGGLAVALPGSYWLHRRSPYYRALPSSVKALGVVAIAVPALIVSAERAGLRFEREQWNDIGKEEMDFVTAREEAEWREKSTSDRVLDTLADHQYSVIFGGWGTAMLGSFGYILQNKHQTLPMKLVQARMYAQGLTIGMVIAGGVLTSIQSRRHKNIDRRDHSWRDMLAAQEVEEARLKEMRRQR